MKDVLAHDNGTTTTLLGEMAAEVSRLYAAFDKAAADLTAGYRKERLAGEEGVTWSVFPRGGFGRPTPILDAIVRHGGAILLGAGYNMWWELLDEYRLTKNTMLVPGGDGTFVKTDAITVRRAGAGYDPGDEYVVIGERILKAGFDHLDATPSSGADGKLAWSPPRDRVNGTFRVLAEVDSELQQVIERLRAYEPEAE